MIVAVSFNEIFNFCLGCFQELGGLNTGQMYRKLYTRFGILQKGIIKTLKCNGN